MHLGIFSRKPAQCTICNKQISHKNKAKREWGVKSPLCSDCYLDKMQESYDATIIKKCISCGVKSKVTDLWEPRTQWDMEGLLCKKCKLSMQIYFLSDANNYFLLITGISPVRSSKFF